jgi:hypothetical protein
MRITISPGGAERAPGLRVIAEIPDYPLCHLEGRNGIGKSVAARLLELATGAQPYAALPSAWVTLREQLGPTTITVSPLPAGGELVFRLKPARWPEHPDPPGDWLGEVTLDGAPVPHTAAWARLRVGRIAGDETLVQTLARDLDERSVVAAALDRRHVRPRADAWEESLSALAGDIGGITRSVLVDAAKGALAAASAAEMADGAAVRAAGVWTAAAAAAEAATALAARRRDLPTLLQALADATTRTDNARVALGDTQTRAQKAAVAVAASQTVRSDIARWERLLGLRQSAWDREQAKERQLLSALALAERPERLRLAELVTDADEQCAAALAARDAVDLVDPRRRLAEQLEQPLAAESPRLGSEVIAQIARPVTVAELLDGVRQVRSDLANRPRADELIELDKAVLAADRRLRLLRALQSQANVTDRKQARVAEADQMLDALFTDLDSSGRTALEQAQAAVREASDAVVKAEVAAREVRKQIAELLEIPAAQPDASVETAAGRPDEADDEDDELAGADAADALYPDLDSDSALAEAARRDRDGAQALRQVDTAALADLARVAQADLAPLVSAADAGPTEPVGEELFVALRWLHSAAVAAHAAADASTSAAAHAANTASTAAVRLNVLRATVRNAHARLTDQESPWAPGVAALLAAAGVPTNPLPGDTATEADSAAEPTAAELAVADALDSVAAIARAQSAAAIDLADRLAALSGYLSATAARVAPGGRDHGARPADFQRGLGDRHRVDRWIEDVLADELTAPELLAELFDGAAKVRVDLTDLTVTWRAPAGGVRRRPLEAFSSGEQVFAYTRANLARLSRNRRPGQAMVVFLDEFGAFVARDRLGQLMDFVEHHAVGRVADQVIVMLPLSRDYPDPADLDGDGNGVGDSMAERARQLAARGYFAVPFTPSRAYAS